MHSNKVIQKLPEYYEIAVHNSSISFLALTYDNKYLITGDENGMIFIMTVSEYFIDGERYDHFKNVSEDKRRVE